MNNIVILNSEDFDKIVSEIKELKSIVNSLKLRDSVKIDWFDNKDLERVLKVGPRTIQKYRDSNLIKYSRIGAKFYYKVEDVDQFIRNHQVDINAGP